MGNILYKVTLIDNKILSATAPNIRAVAKQFKRDKVTKIELVTENAFDEKKETNNENDMSIFCINNGYFVLAKGINDVIQYMKENYDYVKIKSIRNLDYDDYIRMPIDLEKDASKLCEILKEHSNMSYCLFYDDYYKSNFIEITSKEAIKLKDVKETNLLCFSEEEEEYEN